MDYCREHFPLYPWVQNAPFDTAPLLASLTLPSAVRPFMWRYPDQLLRPLHRYLTQLRWPVQKTHVTSLGVSWLELAIDFWCATFVTPHADGRPHLQAPGVLRQRRAPDLQGLRRQPPALAARR